MFSKMPSKTRTLQAFGRQLDILLSPPYVYRNFGLKKQNAELFHRIMLGQYRTKNTVLLIKHIVLYAIGVALTPIACVLRFAGIRFFMVDLRQVGSVLWLDLYLREMKLKNDKYRKMFVLRSKTRDANGFFIDRYAEYVTFVSNPILKLVLAPFFLNPWFRDDGFRYEISFERTNTLPEKRSFAHPVCNAYIDKFGRPLIGFSRR